MRFNILDLFSGAGGFSKGFDTHKDFNTAIAVDFDKAALNTFSKNFPNTITISGDLTDNSLKNNIIRLSKEKGVNMIIGGPPCQGFSLKGKKLGLNDPRNYLFLEFIKIVEKVRPEIFIIENVKSMLTAADGYFKEEIINRFEKLGYIIEHDVLNAMNFGVPQNRQRAIIIGSLSLKINLNKKADENQFVTVREAISDLSFLESGEGGFELEYPTPSQSSYQTKLRKNAKKLYNHIATNHSDVALKKLSFIPPEGDKSSLPPEMHGLQKFKTTWARLKWDTVSPTIDTRFDTPSNGRNSHPYLNRSITAREAARIQSFPDDFIFYGNKGDICRQVGNAVPPLLAYHIAKIISDTYSIQHAEMEIGELIQADSFAYIEQLKKNKVRVDHIITDPPYNISKENNFDTMKNPRKGVDFGHWDNGFDLFSWIPKYLDVLNKDGSIIIFCSYYFISDLIRELNNSGAIVKDVLIWQKTNPMPRNVERRYVQDMEFAIWAVKKNAKWTFNKPKNVPYLRSIFASSVVSGKERYKHPTQKSLDIMKKIVKIHTNERDVILDPFMGTGSTGVAAKELNRQFIGIEVNPNYYNIAKKRITNK